MNKIKYYEAEKDQLKLTLTRPVKKNGNEAVYFKLLRCIVFHPFHTQNEYNRMIGKNYKKEARYYNSYYQALALHGLVKTSRKYNYMATEKGMEYFFENDK